MFSTLVCTRQIRGWPGLVCSALDSRRGRSFQPDFLGLGWKEWLASFEEDASMRLRGLGGNSGFGRMMWFGAKVWRFV